jgi:hypothetical protein
MFFEGAFPNIIFFMLTRSDKSDILNLSLCTAIIIITTVQTEQAMNHYDLWGWAANAAADDILHLWDSIECSIGVFFCTSLSCSCRK